MGSSVSTLVAGVEQQLADQVQRLLRAGGDEHVVGRDLDPVARHVPHQQLAQREVALGGAVLQRGAAVLARARAAAAASTSASGNTSGAGSPPAKEMISGFSVSLSSSRIAELVTPLGALGEAVRPGRLGVSLGQSSLPWSLLL